MGRSQEPISLDQPTGVSLAPHAQEDTPSVDIQALSKPSQLGGALPGSPFATNPQKSAQTGDAEATGSPPSCPEAVPSSSASSSLTKGAPDRPREITQSGPSAFQSSPYASPSSQRSERSFTGRSPVRQSALEAPRTSTEYMLPQLPTVAAAAFRLPEVKPPNAFASRLYGREEGK